MSLAEFKTLVEQNRSCRRFDNSHKLEQSLLKQLVNLARQTASAANLQPLKYIICCDDNKNQEIFSCLGWAAYLTDWKGPEKKERPSGYIIILGDHSITDNFWCDHGIAAQTILLGARSMGLAGCIFGSVNTPKLKKHLNITDLFEIKLVLAIGKPIEQHKIEEPGKDNDIKYYRDADQVHHVPKRKLDDIIIGSW